MYSRINGACDARLAPHGPLLVSRSVGMLYHSWGVEGRGREVRHGEAMQVLDWLGRRGHRAELAEPGDREAAIDLLAWDIARGVNVARHAYHAQYISAEEAWTHTRGAARAAQESFPSWEPRERTDNRALVARAERLHEEVLGETRQAIVAFEGVLQNGKLEKIEKQRRKLAEMLDRIDREFRL